MVEASTMLDHFYMLAFHGAKRRKRHPSDGCPDAHPTNDTTHPTNDSTPVCHPA